MAEGTADVLVVFGITGDLAKVMTFRSLYRLEKRGLLDFPIVGVAVDDWSVDELRERARESIEGTGERSTEGVRPLRRAALLRGRATSATRRPTSASARRSAGASSAGLLPRDPAVPLRHGREGARRRRAARSARVVVEKPFGHDRESARALAAGAARVPRRVQLYRIDHFLGKMGLEEILYLRFANTMLEPVWNRNFVPACRSRWLRTSASRTAATSTTRSARCATWSSTTCCRWSPPRRWKRRRGPTR